MDMLAFRPSRVGVVLFASILALVIVISSAAHPRTADAQGIPPYCAAGYVSNGVSCVFGSGNYCPYAGYPGCTTAYGTCNYGTAGCVGGVCQGGYTSNGAGGCTYTGSAYGTCNYGTAGCVGGICQGGYTSNGAGGCTYTGATNGTCTYGTAGCVSGICQGGYTSNGAGGCNYTGATNGNYTGTTYGPCTNGTAGCVGSACQAGYTPNGATCTYTGAASGACTNGTAGCINGVCTSGYLSNGANGCSLSGAGNCPAGTAWNGSTCVATGAAVGGIPVQTQLTNGCNLVVVEFGAGATPQQVVSATSNTSAVLSVWGWDNTRQRWMGYFPTQSTASDLVSLPARAGVFVCVNSAITLTAP